MCAKCVNRNVPVKIVIYDATRPLFPDDVVIWKRCFPIAGAFDARSTLEDRIEVFNVEESSYVVSGVDRSAKLWELATARRRVCIYELVRCVYDSRDTSRSWCKHTDLNVAYDGALCQIEIIQYQGPRVWTIDLATFLHTLHEINRGYKLCTSVHFYHEPIMPGSHVAFDQMLWRTPHADTLERPHAVVCGTRGCDLRADS